MDWPGPLAQPRATLALLFLQLGPGVLELFEDLTHLLDGVVDVVLFDRTTQVPDLILYVLL